MCPIVCLSSALFHCCFWIHSLSFSCCVFRFGYVFISACCSCVSNFQFWWGFCCHIRMFFVLAPCIFVDVMGRVLDLVCCSEILRMFRDYGLFGSFPWVLCIFACRSHYVVAIAACWLSILGLFALLLCCSGSVGLSLCSRFVCLSCLCLSMWLLFVCVFLWFLFGVLFLCVFLVVLLPLWRTWAFAMCSLVLGCFCMIGIIVAHFLFPFRHGVWSYYVFVFGVLIFPT